MKWRGECYSFIDLGTRVTYERVKARVALLNPTSEEERPEILIDADILKLKLKRIRIEVKFK